MVTEVWYVSTAIEAVIKKPKNSTAKGTYEAGV